MRHSDALEILSYIFGYVYHTLKWPRNAIASRIHFFANFVTFFF